MDQKNYDFKQYQEIFVKKEDKQCFYACPSLLSFLDFIFWTLISLKNGVRFALTAPRRFSERSVASSLELSLKVFGLLPSPHNQLT